MNLPDIHLPRSVVVAGLAAVVLAGAWTILNTAPENKRRPAIQGQKVSDQSLGSLLALPDEIPFLAGFSHHLQHLPAEDLPGLREKLEAGWRAKMLPTRHQAQARALIGQKSAGLDPAGYLASIRSGDSRGDHLAILIALRKVFAEDPGAGIREFRRLTDNRDSLWRHAPVVSGFLAGLAADDPERAGDELLALTKRASGDLAYADAMAKVWAGKDPVSALAFLPRLAEVEDGGRFTGALLAALWPDDSNRVMDWLAGQDNPGKRDARVAAMIRRFPDGAVEPLIEAAGRIDLPVAWESAAHHLRAAGAGNPTFARLLAAAPAETHQRLYVAWFDVHPSRLASRPPDYSPVTGIPDAGARLEALAALAAGPVQFGLPFSPAFREALTAERPGAVLAKFEPPHRTPFLKALLTLDRFAGLDWLRGLPPSEWKEMVSSVVYSWPEDHLGEDVRVMIRRDPADYPEGLVTAMAEAWYAAEPVDAFPVLAPGMAAWLGEERQVAMLAEACQDIPGRAVALFETLPTAADRDQARKSYGTWDIKRRPDDDQLKLVWSRVEASNRDPAVIEKAIGETREFPDTRVDEMILMLPAEHPGRDGWLARRGSDHFAAGRHDQAVAIWKKVQSPRALSQPLSIAVNQTAPPAIWGEMILLADTLPAEVAPDDSLRSFCYRLAVANNRQALELAGTTPSRRVRKKLLIAVEEAARSNARLRDIVAACEAAGAAEDADPEIRALLARARARLDPAGGLRAVLDNPEVPDNEARDAMRVMCGEYPSQALAVLASHPGHRLAPALFRELVEALAVDDPELVFPAVVAWSSERDRHSSISHVLVHWSRRDPVAAAAAALTLPAGPLRDTFLGQVIETWLVSDATGVMAWADALPEPGNRGSAWNAILRKMDGPEIPRATRRWLTMPWEEPAAVEPDILMAATNRLAAFSHAEAAFFLAVGMDKLWRANPGKSAPLFQKGLPVAGNLFAAWEASEPSVITRAAGWPVVSLLRDVARRKPVDPSREENPRPPDSDPGMLARIRDLADNHGPAVAMRAVASRPAGYRRVNAFFAMASWAIDHDQSEWVQRIREHADKHHATPGYLAALSAAVAPDGKWDADTTRRMIGKLAAWPDTNTARDALVMTIKRWRDEPMRVADLIALCRDFPAVANASRAYIELFLPQDARRVVRVEAMLPGPMNDPPVSSQLRELCRALLDADKAKTLGVASRLPQPWADPILCGVLAGMTREETETAVAALPAPARARMLAWWKSVHPPPGG